MTILTKVQTNGVDFSGSTDLNIDGGTLFVDATNNRVGVGTTSPSYLLDLSASSDAPLHINSTNANGPHIRLAASGTVKHYFGSGGGFSLGDADDFAIRAADNILFATGNSSTEKVRIDSSGRVGIGTSSPGSNLDVRGSSTGTLNLQGGSAYAQLTLTDGGSGTNYIDSTNTNLSIRTNNSSWLRLGTNNTTAVHIDSSQRVGIGTTSAGTNLSIGASASGGYNGGVYLNRGASSYNFYEASDGTNTVIFGLDNTLSNAKIGSINSYPIGFYTGNVERARIDSSGRLLVGTSTSFDGNAQFQSVGSIAGQFYRFGADDGSIHIGSAKGTVGSPTTLANGEALGSLHFRGYNGTNYRTGAWIYAIADATISGDEMPTRLVFSTTADGASSPTERARITQAGVFKATNSASYQGATSDSHEFRNQVADASSFYISSTSGSFARSGIVVNCHRTASTAYNFLLLASGNEADNEFVLRGDGNAFADGTWSGGGADYAEYFEWSDANPDEEDRRGISVVLDGDKIREAATGEDPIGVISGNPSVVGDAAWNKWSGKYLRDDFGTYILEDYEVVNDEGETVVQQRRKLNPAYDPDQEYTSREQRPEWDCVGLMGKLRIRKGQVTGSRWIKMRDISDSVEEWLVR